MTTTATMSVQSLSWDKNNTIVKSISQVMIPPFILVLISSASSSIVARILALAILVPLVLPHVWKVIRRRLVGGGVGRQTIQIDDDGNKTMEVVLPPMAPPGILDTINSLSQPNVHEEWLRHVHEVGSFIFRIRLPYPGAPNVMIVGEPSIAREILMDPHSTKPTLMYEGAGTIAGGDQNILSTPDTSLPRWKHARKSVAHAFSSNQVKRMLEVCKEKTEQWIEGRLLSKEHDPMAVDKEEGVVFEPNYEFRKLTTEIICKSAFEYDISEQDVEIFLHGSKLGLEEVPKAMMNPLREGPLSCLFPDAQHATEALKELQVLAFHILDDFRNTHYDHDAGGSASIKNKKEDNNEEDEPTEQPPVPTVLRCIVEDEEYEDDDDRVRDMVIFLVAGHDTTAYALSWMMLELARKKHTTTKLRKALAACPNNEDDWVDDPYLKCFVKEVLRMHPIVPIGTPRQTARDFLFRPTTEQQQEGTKRSCSSPTAATPYLIPKGTVVFPSSYLTHRHPNVFDKPEEFRPSRWETLPDHDDAAAAAAKNIAFQPFSAGPRACVGMPLAYSELYHVVAKLVMNFDFEVVDPGISEMRGTLRPTGLKLRAIPLQTKT